MEQGYFYDVNIQLRLSYPEQVQFDTEMYLTDSDEVPIYDRVRVVTQYGVDDLDTSGDVYAPARDFYSQELKAASLTLARVPKTAIPPAFVCGTHSTDATLWAALGASATVTVTDSDSATDTVTCGTFVGVTTFAQALVVLNAGLAALSSPNITGLDTATFALDYAGKVVLSMPAGQDDTDPTISIDFNATPASIAYLLGVITATDGDEVPGNAVETLLEAYNAAKVLGSSYNITVADRGGNDTEVIALAAQIQTERAQLTVVDTSVNAPDAGSSADLQSVLAALGYDQTTVIYTSKTDYPDLAADGAWLPADPGSKSYGHTPLSGVLGSGAIGPKNDLTDTQKTALDAKGANYVVHVGNDVFIHRGKTAGGTEKRMILLKHWLEANMQNDLQAYDMNADLVAFDRVTLGALDGILRKWLKLAVKKRGIKSFSITLPTVADFTSAEKASGDMVITNAFTAVGVFEAHTFTINGSIGLS